MTPDQGGGKRRRLLMRLIEAAVSTINYFICL